MAEIPEPHGTSVTERWMLAFWAVILALIVAGIIADALGVPLQ